jgi:dolichol-phosphate mannosyltransferase
MVSATVRAAIDSGLDMVSFSPCFAGLSAGQRWLHPAMLMTLVYRFGPPSPKSPANRVMANGQCMLVRRNALLANGGFADARASFADDVTLARSYAAKGLRVGFLDGARLYRVRSYASLRELWREWGRSIDLTDATGRFAQLGDVLLLVLLLGLPIYVIAAQLTSVLVPEGHAGVWRVLLAVNAGLVLARIGLLAAVRGSYESRGIAFWLSPLADLAAVARVIMSSVRRPRRWRGRDYTGLAQIASRVGRTARIGTQSNDPS